MSTCSNIHIVACRLPRGSKLRWREDMGGGFPKRAGPRIGWSLQPTELNGTRELPYVQVFDTGGCKTPM